MYVATVCSAINDQIFWYFSPGGIPARNHKGERLLLFVGIIDILQSYRLRKKLEHTFKAMIHDGVSFEKIEKKWERKIEEKKD
jgi:hypothetical protein